MKTIIKSALFSAFICGGFIGAYAQTDQQKIAIARSSDIATLNALADQFNKTYQENYQKALLVARQNDLPLKRVRPDGGIEVLQGITADGRLFYYGTSNHGSAITSRVDKIQNGNNGLNVDGTGMFGGLWEVGGVDKSHPGLVNRIINYDNANPTIDYHATHVAGTMICDGTAGTVNSTTGIPDGRGMAYKAQLYASDLNNDLAEMAKAAAEKSLLISNHSYGLTASSATTLDYGTYDTYAKSIDDITFAAPYYQPVIAAGNDRAISNVNSAKQGHDLMSRYCNSKNAVVVAAVSEVDNYTGPSSVVMAPFSNWGPTDDNRIKPDISTKGVQVYSSFDTTHYAAKYWLLDGTSMATPGIAGTLLLLQQHYSNVNAAKFMRSATLRALVASTADEAGDFDGPDSKFGWGLMNAERAAKVISNVPLNKSVMSELTLAQGATYTRTVQATGTEPLIATIAWTEKSGTVQTTIDSKTAVLLNDLDIRVTKDSNVYMPWKLNDVIDQASVQGDNKVDNIEKVEVNNAVFGTYTITVTHKGTLTGPDASHTGANAYQNFSLIVSGIDQTLGVEKNDFKEFNVWPNPSKDIVNVSMKSDLSDDANVTLYDIQGKRIIDQKLMSTNDMMTGTLDISSLNTGIYLIKVTQGNKQSVRKLVKE